MELLWRAALLLEEGDLTDVAERLRRAQERLAEALENGASDEEIARLMDELRQAMNEYMQELARQAMQNLDQLQQQAPGDRTLGMQDLQQMLDEMQRMAESGQREMAREMLRQLQRMLENLRMQAQNGGQGQQGEGEQTLQELQDMLEQQQGLADRSFGEMQRRQGQQGRQGEGQQGQQGQNGQQGRNGQQGQNGEQGRDGQQGRQGQGGTGSGTDLGRLSQEQEALRRLLEDLRSGLPGGLSPEAEQALRDAERSMGEARDSLEADDPGAALDEQVDAMESLREGARQLGDAMRRQAQQGQGDQTGRGDPSGSRRAVDPLGRPSAQDGALDGSDTDVPGAEALKRAREILEELRRRSGERTRPELELDYLRRLLDRF